MPSLFLSGFEKSEEQALAHLLRLKEAANWSFASEELADLIVIDLDSIYGHMIWLNARSTGRASLGLSVGARAETDYFLRKPIVAAELHARLAEIELDLKRKALGGQSSERVLKVTGEHPAFTAEPAAKAKAAEPEPAQKPRTAATTKEARRLRDWLDTPDLPMRIRIAPKHVPALVLDRSRDEFFTHGTLSDLMKYAKILINANEIQGLDTLEQKQDMRPFPLRRLAWILGYGMGEGLLLPEFSAAENFRLLLWPQIEREYPAHYKLATVLMRNELSIAQIVERTGVEETEIRNFLNAGLCSGLIKSRPNTESGLLLRKLRRAALAGADS